MNPDAAPTEVKRKPTGIKMIPMAEIVQKFKGDFSELGQLPQTEKGRVEFEKIKEKIRTALEKEAGKPIKDIKIEGNQLAIDFSSGAQTAQNSTPDQPVPFSADNMYRAHEVTIKPPEPPLKQTEVFNTCPKCGEFYFKSVTVCSKCGYGKNDATVQQPASKPITTVPPLPQTRVNIPNFSTTPATSTPIKRDPLMEAGTLGDIDLSHSPRVMPDVELATISPDSNPEQDNLQLPKPLSMPSTPPISAPEASSTSLTSLLKDELKMAIESGNKDIILRKIEDIVTLATKRLKELDREDEIEDLEDKIEVKRREITSAWFKGKKIEELNSMETNIDRLENPFKWFIIDQIASKNFEIIFGTDKRNVRVLDRGIFENNKDGRRCKLFTMDLIEKKTDYAVDLSSNGFYTRLENASKVRDKDGIKIDDPKAVYTLITPNGKGEIGNLNYRQAREKLMEHALGYQEDKLTEFERQSSTD